MNRPASGALAVGWRAPLLAAVVVHWLGVAAVLVPFHAAAQGVGHPTWPGDVAVSVAAGDQGVGSADGPGVAVVSDGAGGVIVVWEDAGTSQIYAQRVDAGGNALWASGGVPIAPAAGAQMSPRAVSDGHGGVIAAWIDGRSPAAFCGPGFMADCQVAVQRLDSGGAPLWGGAGMLIGRANQAISEAAIFQNGDGGAAFLWESIAGSGECCAFFAQYVDGAGSPRWGSATGGVQFTPDPSHILGGNFVPPAAVSDGAGGALIAYLFYQVDPIAQAPYTVVQRVLANGTLAMPLNGVPVAGGDLSSRGRVAIVADGAGGAVLVLGKYDRARFSDDLIVQRVDGSGSSLWGATGQPLVSAANYQEQAQIVSDGAGGWIVAWADERNSEYAGCEKLTGDCDVYAQRIDATGTALWQADGVPVTRAPGNQLFPRAVSDGAGGAVIAFQDCRYGNDGNFSCDFGRDLFAQRLSSSGAPLWTPDGVAVTTAAWNQGLDYGTQMVPSFAIADDGAHGAVLAWPDGRAVPCPLTVGVRECDLYVQRVSDSTGPAPSADLIVTAAVSPTPAPVGVSPSYVVHVRNEGPDRAHGVVLKLQFAPQLDAALTSSTACLGTDYKVELCALGDLDVGTDAAVSFSLSNAGSGTYVNTAQAHATEIDPVEGNNSASTPARVASDFSVDAAPTSETVQSGQTATYALTIHSLGGVLDETPGLSCAGAPGMSTCRFTPPLGIPGTLDLQTTLKVDTTAPTTASLGRGGPTDPYATLLLPFAALLAFGRRSRRSSGSGGILAVLLVLTQACSGAGSGGTTRSGGTPSGTYAITVTGATSTFSHSTVVTLIVR